MMGTGSLIVSHDSGWACAREAIMGMEFDLKPDKTATKTLVIDIKGLFNAVGVLSGNVKGIFKLDGGDKIAFNGVMYGRSKIIIQGDTNKDFQLIIKNIEKWQEHYQAN